MTRQEALVHVLAIASTWAENAEEAFARRVNPDDTDDQCQANADAGCALLEEVIEVRDLWRAIKILEQNND